MPKEPEKPSIQLPDNLPSHVHVDETPSYLVANFVTSVRATAVALGMYPPGSQSVQNALSKVVEDQARVFDKMGAEFTLGSVEGKLLVNGTPLDEKEQKRDPIVNFVKALKDRNIASVTFNKGIDREELIRFMLVFSKRPKELLAAGPFPQLLARERVTHVRADELLYIATSKAEEERRRVWEEVASQVLREGGSLKAADAGALEHMYADPEAVKNFFRSMGEGIGEGLGGDEIESAAMNLYQMVERSAELIEQQEDPAKKEVLIDGLAEMLKQMEDQVLVRFLLMEEQNPGRFKSNDLERLVFQRLDADRIVKITESVLGEVDAFKRKAHTLGEEERKATSAGLKSIIRNLVHFTQDREVFLDVAERLGNMGLVKDQVVEEARTKFQKTGVEATLSRLLDGDGRMNMEAMDMLVRQLEKSTPAEMMSAVEALSTTLRDLVSSDEASNLVQAIVSRVQAETEMTESYRQVADFLRTGAEEALQAGNINLAVEAIAALDNERQNQDKPVEMRLAAENALAKVASRDMAAILDRVIRSGDTELQGQVFGIVKRLDQRMIEPLMQVLRTSGDRNVRRHVIDLITDMGPSVVDALVRELEHSKNEWFMVRNLVLLLGRLGTPVHFNTVAAFADDAEPRVRREVLRAACRLDPHRGEELCIRVLKDKNKELQRFAVNLLGVHGTSTAAEELLVLLDKVWVYQDEPDSTFQREVARSIEQIRPISLTDRVVLLLAPEPWYSLKRTKPAGVRAALCRVLGVIGNTEAVKALQTLSKDRSPEVANAAQEVLIPLQRAAAEAIKGDAGQSQSARIRRFN